MAKSTLTVQVVYDMDVADMTQAMKTASGSPKSSGLAVDAITRVLNGLANGAIRTTGDSITVTVPDATENVAATGSITVAFANIDNLDTVTIGGTVLTAVTAVPANAYQFRLITDTNTTAANLRACINALSNIAVTANGSAATVALTAKPAGALGNAVTLATSDADGLVISGATLTGGVTGDDSYVVL